MYDNYKSIKVKKDNRTIYIIIDNPPVNEISDDMDEELSEVFVDIGRDPEVKVVILTGSGSRVFCAGGSLDERIDCSTNKEYSNWLKQMRRARRILMNMLDLDVPIIARVQGHAIGLGATLACYADIAIAANHAKFADPHVQIGLTAGDGGAIVWPRHIGLTRAKYFLLTGDRMSAAQAAEFGLIHKAVPIEQLDAEVAEVRDKLLALPKLAVATTKRALNVALLKDVVQSLDGNLGLETLSMLHEDHLVAVSAIRGKRVPVPK